MFDYYRYYRKSGPSSLSDKLRLHSLVSFFSTRVIRGGPRILLHLAATLVVVLLIAKLAPSPFFGSLYSSTSFFSWNPDRVAQAVSGEIRLDAEYRPITPSDSALVLGDDRKVQDAAAGGLRIVVFGKDDVGTPSRLHTYRGTRRPSWTELLCHELNCTSYLSFTEDFDVSSYSVVSQELHSAAVRLLLEESSKETTGGGKPGKDYSFYPANFFIDRGRPDLARQIQSFLAMDKPRHPPSETLWVFTLGAWDVWSLASMPTSISKPVVGLLTNHIFEQVELLYRSSLHKTSVAFSGLDTNVTSGGEIPFEAQPGKRGTFRILIPTLFDPSLTPGWARSRPELPEAHSNAEQLRNSVYLTEEWNDQLLTKLEKWISQPYITPSDITRSWRGGNRGAASTETVPPPQRDAFAYDMAGSLIDIMMEEQLRVADIKTQIALGKSSGSTMMDVMKPCVVGGSLGLKSGDDKNNNRYSKPDPRTKSDGRDGDGETYKKQKPPASTAVICRAPDEHLFYSEFELGTRTISAIARQVGGMVVRNESVRAAWAAEDRKKGV